MSASESISRAWRDLTGTDEGEEWFDVDAEDVLDEDRPMYRGKYLDRVLAKEYGPPGEGERKACPVCLSVKISPKGAVRGIRENSENWVCYGRCKDHFNDPVIIQFTGAPKIFESERRLWEADPDDWRPEGSTP